MELIKINYKNGFIYRLNGFPQSIKNGKLEYLDNNREWKKTNKFELIENNLPERSEKLSWLEICKIYDLYGLEVANEYAECKVAGIVSKSYLLGYYGLYQRAKDIINLIDDNIINWFFDLLKPDYFLSICGVSSLDIIELDNNLSKIDPEYDSYNCTYKGENKSLAEYLEIKYGSIYRDLVNVLVSV